MARLVSLVGFWVFGFLLMVAPRPVVPWYKHTASPRYHTVGRASGLLIGVRRSPYLWRRDIVGSQDELGNKVGATYGQQNPEEKSSLIENLYEKLEEEERSLHDLGLIFKNPRAEVGHSEDQTEDRRDLKNKLGVQLLEPLEGGLNKQSMPGTDLRLETSQMAVKEPEEKRMLEVNWPIIGAGDQTRSLEGLLAESLNDARTLNRGMRGLPDPGQAIEPNRENFLSNLLKQNLEEERRPYPQPWRRLLPTDQQVLYPNTQTSESVNCEEPALTSHRILCRMSLLFHFQSSHPRLALSPAAEDPEPAL